MIDYIVTIGALKFDGESSSEIKQIPHFEKETVDDIINFKYTNNSFNETKFHSIILKLFKAGLMIINSEDNLKIFEDVIISEDIEAITALMNYTDMEINDVDMNLLEFELGCTTAHVKHFFRFKVNDDIPDSERSTLTIDQIAEVCPDFEWINEGMGYFRINNCKSVLGFDETICKKLDRAQHQFTKERKTLFTTTKMATAPKKGDPDIIGILHKPQFKKNNNKSKIVDSNNWSGLETLASKCHTDDEN